MKDEINRFMLEHIVVIKENERFDFSGKVIENEKPKNEKTEQTEKQKLKK